ncbi:hypothetical protein Avbf_06010, partial [Armadillidium vulgare]
SSSPKVIYSKRPEQAANRTTPSESPDSKDSNPCNVRRSFTRNVRSRQQIGLHRLSLLTLRINILVMVICLASFFRSFTRKRTALTANSTTPSDSPDSRDSYLCNGYMPSIIFRCQRAKEFSVQKCFKN